MKSAVCLGLVLAGAVFGQATFDGQSPSCSYAFPITCGTAGDIEGITMLAAPGAFGNPATVDTANGAGFPCAGSQYGRIYASGPYTPSAGGNEMHIPIPLGATSISFCWDFYNSEGGPSTSFNDGMSIDLLAPTCGAVLQNLVYADTNTPTDGGTDGSPCGTFASGCLTSGANMFGPMAIPSGAGTVRILVWNGGDNAVASNAVIDSVCFDNAPCISPCSLLFLQPAPGQLLMANTQCPQLAGTAYLNAISLAPGTFPNGWFFGIDIPWTQLLSEFSQGYPFTGTLGPIGESSFLLPSGAPSGLQLWAVSVQFAPGFGNFLFARPPVTFTIP